MALQTISPPKRKRRWYPPMQGQWTYADYTNLPDNNMRYEIIKGNLYMSPAPRPKHQKISLNLIALLYDFVYDNHLGEIYHAPVDVILSELATPVQPDLLFIAQDQLHIVGETTIKGVPNLIIEIISPGNPEHDRQTKFVLYAQAGVAEYWIVDGDAQTVDVYVLRGQAYALLDHLQMGDDLFSEQLGDFTITTDEIFA